MCLLTKYEFFYQVKEEKEKKKKKKNSGWINSEVVLFWTLKCHTQRAEERK